MTKPDDPPRLYSDLATWWPLLSPPSHDTEEAEDLLLDLRGACDAPPRTLLELGAGGGSLAFKLKRHFRLTLTDRSDGRSLWVGESRESHGLLRTANALA